MVCVSNCVGTRLVESSDPIFTLLTESEFLYQRGFIFHPRSARNREGAFCRLYTPPLHSFDGRRERDGPRDTPPL
jgi:hypothetical protein